MSKLYGVAINDADYKVRVTENYTKPCGKRTSRDLWVCPYFSRWKNLISRVYGTSKKKAYDGVTVCEDWLLFSNFKAWMESQNWVGMQLDKDLKVKGNKVYSPETCMFIPAEVNSFLIDQKKSEKFKGTSWHIHCEKYQVNVSNPFTKKLENLGYFDSKVTANSAYQARKTELAMELAKSYEKSYPEIGSAILKHFNVEVCNEKTT